METGQGHTIPTALMGKRKRKYEFVANEPTTLRGALELVETRRAGSIQTLEDAAVVWNQIAAFRPAQVLLASTKMAPKFFSQEQSDAVGKMITDRLDLYHEISECREFRCCRGPAIAKHMRSSEIIAAVKPLMQSKNGKGNKKKLSI